MRYLLADGRGRDKMRLPDHWYRKYKKDRASHRLAYNRNRTAKRLAKSARLFLWVLLGGLILTTVFYAGQR